MNRYILLDKQDIVVSVRWGSEIVSGEIASIQGEIGQKLVDGKFVDVSVEPQQPVETMDQKIARLEKQLAEQNLMQMEVLATIYEQILGGA